MYGFSGYAANAFGSQRQESGIIGPVVQLGLRIMENGYNAVITLLLRFRNLTLSNPSTNQNTLEL